ncbi:MAG: cytidylate kinase-like family protein [Chloroflexota bacterium]
MSDVENNDVQNNAVGGMQGVTVSREYGSGGGEIAARLAKRLGWQLINHEIVSQVATALGVSEEEAEAYDEHVDSFVSRILYTLSALTPPVVAAMPSQLTTDSRAFDHARRTVVEGAIAAGHVVIVGRGAQVLLADRRDVLHVRMVAPLEQRIKYVMQREGLDRPSAQTRIHLKDRDRAQYLMSEHRQNPADAHLYDILVNTGVLDLDSVVDLLALALERKATRLSTPVEELGPGAGLPLYPEPPGNFNSTLAEG